jgi:DNA phosphorothioation-associated putative methyltransferase
MASLVESLNTPIQIESIAKICRRSSIGKLLPDALYVHHSAIPLLDSVLRSLEQKAQSSINSAQQATLIKFSLIKPQLSYLFYPDFDCDPHPALKLSIKVDLATGQVSTRDYSQTANPPILHRKESFLAANHPLYELFQHLTHQEEALGLLDKPTTTIGTAHGWQQRLDQYGWAIEGHAVVCPIQNTQLQTPKKSKPKIDRHKAAIVRAQSSKPVRLAIEAALFEPSTVFFDYGCGHGADIEYIRRLGYESEGWDPHFRPHVEHQKADIVNLGYVINVVEDMGERREALLKAWALTRKALVVSAQVLINDRANGVIAYGDGIITSRNTFQKYYDQQELKNYIDQVLGVDAVPVALGIYFVFRDDAQAESFRASRFRSRATTPRVRISVKRFEDYKELLQPLMNFYTDRGRLPTAEEAVMEELAPLKTEFGSIRQAFKIILQATDSSEWDDIAEKRRQDLLVYLALSHFGRRPKFGDLAPVVQKDIKSLFGSYQQACMAADLMLMSLGNTDIIAERCKRSQIGQQRPNSLWVHTSALEQLDPLLRLYEGCASRTIGRPKEATIIKFHTGKPKISYLFFPAFDTEPHPALQTKMQISLRDLYVRYQDYNPADNPPLLHLKEQLVMSDYPGYEKFAKLSEQELSWGLLDDFNVICTSRGWERCLESHCAELKGHRVVWKKDVDNYQKKLVQTARRQRLQKME